MELRRELRAYNYYFIHRLHENQKQEEEQRRKKWRQLNYQQQMPGKTLPKQLSD